MIVRSGTSRLVTILGDHVPVHAPHRDELLLSIMLGDDETPGLGGEGYQTNKVCLVRHDRLGRGGRAFRFHFFQILRDERVVRDDMECSNAATAAAVHMMVSGLAGPDAEGVLQTLNEATGQEVRLVPSSRARPWKGFWRIRFLLAADVLPRARAAREHLATLPDGRRVAFSLFRHGNVFMFAKVPPAAVDREVSIALAQAAREAADAEGSAPSGAWDPKVIPYEGAPDRLRAACWYVGERHHSLPGSAAMALGLFLGAPTAAIETPGPVITVHAAPDGSYTEYDTPVRLLLHGAAALPLEVK
jgi:hypothetical protein